MTDHKQNRELSGDPNLPGVPHGHASVDHATRHRLVNTYPELGHFASRDEANAVLRAWQKQMIKTPRFWVGLVIYTIIVGCSALAVLVFLRRWIAFPPAMFGGIVGGVTGGSGAVGLAWFWRSRCRLFLRQQLVARGIPICVKCGYDLRGQTTPRCPECGTPFDASLIPR